MPESSPQLYLKMEPFPFILRPWPLSPCIGIHLMKALANPQPIPTLDNEFITSTLIKGAV